MDIDSLQQSAGLRKEFLLPACLFVFYICFLTQSYYWDGVLFSLNIEKVYEGAMPGSSLLHPNHLLYSGMGYLGYAALEKLGWPVRAITFLQLINVLASVAAAVVLFALAKRLFRSSSLAFGCALLFAGGATWWKFSTDADSYVLSSLLVLTAISLVLSDKGSPLPAAACFTLAMLFHQLAILGYVPLSLALWLKGGAAERRRLQLILFVAGTGAAVAGVYYWAYLFTHTGSAGESFLQWVTSVSKDTKTAHSLRQLFVANALSYGKLFAGGKLSLIRDFISVPVVVSLSVSVASLAAAVLTSRRSKQELPESRELDRATVTVFAAWIAVYFLFLSWFEPGNAFYKLFIWPPIVLLIGWWFSKPAVARPGPLVWIACALASWNFGAFIYPHSHEDADPVVRLARQIDRELPKQATVYYQALSPDDWYLEYFAPGRNWRLLPAGKELPKGTRRAPVCLETTALQVTRVDTDPTRRWDLVNKQHNVRFECLGSTPD